MSINDLGVIRISLVRVIWRGHHNQAELDRRGQASYHHNQQRHRQNKLPRYLRAGEEESIIGSSEAKLPPRLRNRSTYPKQRRRTIRPFLASTRRTIVVR